MADSGLTITATIEHGCHVIRLSERMFVDDAEALMIRARIEEIIEGQKAPRIALSLANVQVVSTAAWGKLMVLQRNMRREGGILALIDVSETVLDVLETMKLHQLFDIRDSVQSIAD